MKEEKLTAEEKVGLKRRAIFLRYYLLAKTAFFFWAINYTFTHAEKVAQVIPYPRFLSVLGFCFYLLYYVDTKKYLRSVKKVIDE